jgi:hypothetical protein
MIFLKSTERVFSEEFISGFGSAKGSAYEQVHSKHCLL